MPNANDVASSPAAGAGPAQVYRLYVSAASPVSSRAIVNAREFFDRHLPGASLAVLDIAEHLPWARVDQIVASPTLIRLRPLPQRRFIGDMSNPEKLRLALGLGALANARGKD